MRTSILLIAVVMITIVLSSADETPNNDAVELISDMPSHYSTEVDDDDETVNDVISDLSVVSCALGTNCEECSGSLRGTCNSQTRKCTCDSQFFGDACQNNSLVCPYYNGMVCSGSGVCDSTKGKCTCYSGRYGDACENIRCPLFNGVECGGNGTCDSKTGQCTCTTGYATSYSTIPYSGTKSYDCGGKLCPFYDNRGTSMECGGRTETCNRQTGVCDCSSNTYWSLDCKEPSCSVFNKCSGNGTCGFYSGSNTSCSCKSGYGGANCSVETSECTATTNCGCPNNCSNKGWCDKNMKKCWCRSGTGSDCSGVEPSPLTEALLAQKLVAYLGPNWIFYNSMNSISDFPNEYCYKWKVVNSSIFSCNSTTKKITSIYLREVHNNLPDLTAFSALENFTIDGGNFTSLPAVNCPAVTLSNLKNITDSAMNLFMTGRKFQHLVFSNMPLLTTLPGISGDGKTCLMQTASNNLGYQVETMTGITMQQFPACLSSYGLFHLKLSNIPGLSGSIPSDFGTLWATTMVYFTLSKLPNLKGSLPTGIFAVPATDRNALQRVTISETGVSGPIPSIYITFNKNSGYTMDISKNQLSGDFPAVDAAVAANSKLTSLDISGNKIAGSFPVGLFSIPELTNINAENNNMSGALPDFSKNVKITNFNIRNNPLISGVFSSALIARMTGSDNKVVNYYGTKVGVTSSFCGTGLTETMVGTVIYTDMNNFYCSTGGMSCCNCTDSGQFSIVENNKYISTRCGSSLSQPRGNCNVTTQKCVCNTGYYGSNCGSIRCPLFNGIECGGSSRGSCNPSKGECICLPNYAGTECGKAVCGTDCAVGTVCHIPTKTCIPNVTPCPNDCCTNGMCSANGSCTCNSGWYGIACSTKTSPCQVNCGSNGTCNSSTGQCTCNTGYTGADCLSKCAASAGVPTPDEESWPSEELQDYYISKDESPKAGNGTQCGLRVVAAQSTAVGWVACDATELIQGLSRSGNTVSSSSLQAYCAKPCGNISIGTCSVRDVSAKTAKSASWAKCGSDEYLQGLYVDSSSTTFEAITKFKCCKLNGKSFTLPKPSSMYTSDDEDTDGYICTEQPTNWSSTSNEMCASSTYRFLHGIKKRGGDKTLSGLVAMEYCGWYTTSSSEEDV